MTATDRTHEPDEAFRAVLDRIEGAREAHPGIPHDSLPIESDLAHRFVLLGNPFRAEGEPGADG